MSITERPLRRHLDIDREVHGYWQNQPDKWVVDVPAKIIHHPATVIYSNVGDNVDGWNIRSFTDPGNLGITRAVIHSLDLGDDPPALRVMADGGTGTSKPTPSAHIGRALTVTPGTYRLTADIKSNHESALAHIQFGDQTATSDPWPATTPIELEETVTGTSITLTLSSIDDPYGVTPGRSVQTIFDNVRVESPGWTEVIPEQGHWEPQPPKWVEDGTPRWERIGIADATRMSIRRGGTRTGIGVRMDVGLATFRMHNAHDPLTGSDLAPGQKIRIIQRLPGMIPGSVVTHPIFTGRIADIEAEYPMNKTTGEASTSVIVTIADAVKIHGTTPRHGVRIGDPFYETFEERIARLAASAIAPIDVPPIGAPIIRYAL